MDIKKELENYIPYNEQEAADKEMFLKALELENIFTRENIFAHFTATSFIFNKSKTKVLMIYHNTYDSWTWTGGHADGDKDLQNVAKKEAMEETGIDKLEIIDNKIFTIDALTTNGHIKRGKYISSHLHLNASFIFEADEKSKLKVKPDENSGVKWIAINDLKNSVSEEYMLAVYQKILDKMKDLGYIK